MLDTDQRPHSFNIFIAIICTLLIAYGTATLFSYYRIDLKYARLVAWIGIVALSFTTVGMYSGYYYKSAIKRFLILNRIGFIGSISIFILINIIAVIATFNFL